MDAEQPSLLPSGNRAQATRRLVPNREKLMAVLTRVAADGPLGANDFSFSRKGQLCQGPRCDAAWFRGRGQGTSSHSVPVLSPGAPVGSSTLSSPRTGP